MRNAIPVYRRLLNTVSVLIMAALVLAHPPHEVHAAGPTIMIIHGEPLPTPIRINLWNEGIGALSGAEYQGDESDLGDRPYLHLGFLWGPDWNAYLDTGGSLDDLQPERATWHGRLYPGNDETHPVIYATGYGYRLLEPDVVNHLEQRGVPVQLDFGTSDAGGGISPAIWWGIGITAMLLAGSIRAARARDPRRKLKADTRYGYR